MRHVILRSRNHLGARRITNINMHARILTSSARNKTKGITSDRSDPRITTPTHRSYRLPVNDAPPIIADRLTCCSALRVLDRVPWSSSPRVLDRVFDRFIILAPAGDAPVTDPTSCAFGMNLSSGKHPPPLLHPPDSLHLSRAQTLYSP